MIDKRRMVTNRQTAPKQRVGGLTGKPAAKPTVGKVNPVRKTATATARPVAKQTVARQPVGNAGAITGFKPTYAKKKY